MHLTLIGALVIAVLLLDLIVFALTRGFLGLPRLGFSFAVIFTAFPCLKCLISELIMNSALEVLCSKIPRIRAPSRLLVAISMCIFLHARDLVSMSEQLSLQVLSLAGCSLVSYKSLPAMTMLGKTLVGLNIQLCHGITSAAVNLLLEQIWRCDVLC